MDYLYTIHFSLTYMLCYTPQPTRQQTLCIVWLLLYTSFTPIYIYIYQFHTHTHTHMHIFSLSLSLWERQQPTTKKHNGLFFVNGKKIAPNISVIQPPPQISKPNTSIHPSIQQKSRLGGGVTRGVRIRVSAYYIDSNQDY